MLSLPGVRSEWTVPPAARNPVQCFDCPRADPNPLPYLYLGLKRDARIDRRNHPNRRRAMHLYNNGGLMSGMNDWVGPVPYAPAPFRGSGSH